MIKHTRTIYYASRFALYLRLFKLSFFFSILKKLTAAMAMLLSLSQYVLVKRVTSSGVFREECYRSALADAEAVFGFNLYIDIYQNGCVYEYVSIATSRRNICSVERRECCFTCVRFGEVVMRRQRMRFFSLEAVRWK